MVYKYISSKQIIAKVFRDFGIQDNDFITDAIEWIGEALDFIGAQRQLVGKTKVFQTFNFRAPLPNDLYSIDSVRYARGEYGNETPSIDDFKYELSQAETEYNAAFFGEEKQGADYRENGYLIDGEYIKTNLENSWIALTYWALPLDNDGYPLVPDMVEFKEALTWKIMEKILLSGHNHPVVNYQFAHQQWLKYCTQARNQANMPDKGAYKLFKEKWVTMIPDYEHNIKELNNFKPYTSATNAIEQSFQNKLIDGN